MSTNKGCEVINQFNTDYGLNKDDLGETPEDAMNAYKEIHLALQRQASEKRELEEHQRSLKRILDRDVQLSGLGVFTTFDPEILDNLADCELANQCESVANQCEP